MRNFLLFLLLIAGQVAFAQQYGIRGKVMDKEIGGLPSASVSLLQPQDSSVVTYTLTNTEGVFNFNGVGEGKYILKITFVGYGPFIRNITTPSGSDTLDLGTIELRPVAIELKEVTVKGDRDPVVVKGDTVEYNAGSYGTRPNANAEQLLKRLPGVDVGSDGNISVQSENVTRIFVDGKEFFGGNLQMATRNLPADAIDKIQVIDGKSEEARFSGIDDGQRQKVINLILKEDRRNMGFGKATAGVGTNSRYAAQGNYNRMDGGNLVSVMGSSNNINNLDLSGGTSEAGRSARPGGRSGQPGLMTAHSGGITAFNQINSKTTVHGNYLLNYSNTGVITNLTRQNFLPGGTALYFENSRQQNTSGLHNAVAGIEHKDSLNTFKINTGFNYSTARMSAVSSRQSYSVADTLVNEGERNSLNQNKNLNFNASAFYGHRFGKSGRLFTVNNQVSANLDDLNGQSLSFTRFADGGDENLQQQNTEGTRDISFNTTFSYTEPIGKKQYLQAGYTVSNRSSATDLEVFDVFNETRVLNPEQSSRFRSLFLYQQVGLSYRLNRGKLNLSLGLNAQQSDLSGRFGEPAEKIKRSYQNVLPNFNFNQQINKSTRMGFVYGTSIREPNINQLQPVVSRFDPLNLYIGNPGLRPEYLHQGKLTLNTVRPKSGLFVTASVNFNYNASPITAAVTIDERQVRTTQYVNVRQSGSVAAFLNVSLPVKKINSRFNLSPYFRQGQSVNLLNGVAGTVNQQSAGGSIGYTYRYKQYLDVNLRTHVTVTRSRYQLNQAQNQKFINSGHEGDATVHFLKRFNATAELNYTRFTNRSAGFNQSVPICNLSVSSFLLKDNRGELRLSAFNVLNRNAGVTQFASLNYIEQSTHNALGNFYMLSFTYNLNKQQ